MGCFIALIDDLVVMRGRDVLQSVVAMREEMYQLGFYSFIDYREYLKEHRLSAGMQWEYILKQQERISEMDALELRQFSQIVLRDLKDDPANIAQRHLLLSVIGSMESANLEIGEMKAWFIEDTLQYQPFNPVWHIALAELYLMRMQEEEFLRYFARALALDEANHHVLALAGAYSDFFLKQEIEISAHAEGAFADFVRAAAVMEFSRGSMKVSSSSALALSKNERGQGENEIVCLEAFLARDLLNAFRQVDGKPVFTFVFQGTDKDVRRQAKQTFSWRRFINLMLTGRLKEFAAVLFIQRSERGVYYAVVIDRMWRIKLGLNKILRCEIDIEDYEFVLEISAFFDKKLIYLHDISLGRSDLVIDSLRGKGLMSLTFKNAAFFLEKEYPGWVFEARTICSSSEAIFHWLKKYFRAGPVDNSMLWRGRMGINHGSSPLAQVVHKLPPFKKLPNQAKALEAVKEIVDGALQRGKLLLIIEGDSGVGKSYVAKLIYGLYRLHSRRCVERDRYCRYGVGIDVVKLESNIKKALKAGSIDLVILSGLDCSVYRGLHDNVVIIKVAADNDSRLF
jgi:hypothetical protein